MAAAATVERRGVPVLQEPSSRQAIPSAFSTLNATFIDLAGPLTRAVSFNVNQVARLLFDNPYIGTSEKNNVRRRIQEMGTSCEALIQRAQEATEEARALSERMGDGEEDGELVCIDGSSITVRKYCLLVRDSLTESVGVVSGMITDLRGVIAAESQENMDLEVLPEDGPNDVLGREIRPAEVVCRAVEEMAQGIIGSSDDDVMRELRESMMRLEQTLQQRRVARSPISPVKPFRRQFSEVPSAGVAPLQSVSDVLRTISSDSSADGTSPWAPHPTVMRFADAVDRVMQRATATLQPHVEERGDDGGVV